MKNKNQTISREVFSLLFTEFAKKAVKAQQDLNGSTDMDNAFKLGFQNGIMNCMQYLCDAYNEMRWGKDENNK